VSPLAQLIEAALYSAAHPLALDDLARLAPEASREEVEFAVAELRAHLAEHGHAIEVVAVGEGLQLLTKSAFADAIAEAQIVRRPRKLSRPALETLAVIAYRQPVSRAEIEEIRGVSAESVLRHLQERGLAEAVGRGEGLGRPLLYGTSAAFLEHLGLESLDDLPRLEELSVALRPASAGEPEEE
jgi:segregation and condensation protein B